MPDIVECYPALIVFSGTADVDVSLVPQNDKTNSKFAAWFAVHGAKTTVAITQGDAGRSGLGSTATPYDTLKFALS